MKVNGFLLQQAIKRWELRRDTASNQFSDTLFKFKDETKASPDSVFKDFVTAEDAIVKLETAQAKYNLKVIVDLAPGRQMTLTEAVKRLGGAGRGEKMWKTATNPKKDRYGYGSPTERTSNTERATYVLSTSEMMSRADKAAQSTGLLRAAIARGNGTEFDAADIGLEPALLTE